MTSSLPSFPSFFSSAQLQDILNGLALGGVDKAAGIHDCNVCKRSVIAQLKARVFQARHQHFAVHLVFGTAKADQFPRLIAMYITLSRCISKL